MAVLITILSGCDPTSGRHSYEIIYPSGMSLNAATKFNEVYPIEGSDLLLKTERLTDKEYMLHIQNAENKNLYAFETAMRVNRGMVADGVLWISLEDWDVGYRRQFVDGTLKLASIFAIDVTLGEIVFQEKI